MSTSPLHDKTQNVRNLPRKRLILDYVDPYGGSWITEFTASSLRESINHTNVSSGLPPKNEELDMLHRRKEKRLLESWQSISPTKLDPGILSLSSFAVPVVSTSKYKYQTRRKSPSGIEQLPQSSLPPSSPPSLGNHLDIALKEDDDKENEQDPFGFLAMEQILKARKRPLLAKRSGFLRREIERGPFIGGIGGCANAAGNSPHDNGIIRQQESFPDGRRRLSTRSPEQGESQPSSPCQRFARRKSENQDGTQKVEREKLKKQDDHRREPEIIHEIIQRENVVSIRPRKRTGRRGRGGGGKRGTTYHGPEALEREELEKEKREERIRYYQRLESYHLAKENVWVI